MTTPIGYAAVQLIPSLDGFSASVDKQLSGMKGMGKSLGRSLGTDIVSGVDAAAKRVEQASTKIQAARDKEAGAADKVRAAEARIEEVREKGGSALARAETQRNAAQRQQAAALRDVERNTKDLTDAQERLARAQEDVARGPKGDSSSWLDRLKSKAGDAVGSLQGISGSFAGAGSDVGAGFVDGFGDVVGELGTKAGPIGAALTAAAGIGLAAGVVIGQQVMAGISNEAQADQIQARFGLDDSTMATLGKGAADAYAQNFGESITGNLEGAAVALQNGLLPTGATEAETSAAVAQLSTVATVLGVEIPEAARSAGQLMRTGFADNFTQAADLIVAGSQSGLNISEDWLDTVNEYSTQFRKLGIDGPEALGLLSQAVKGGARDTDVAADALKEFSIRSIDGSKNTMSAFNTLGLDFEKTTDALAAGGPKAREAFGTILTEIQKIPDAYTKAQVQTYLFGTQAEDLGDALNAFDLSTATQQLGQFDGAAKRASDTLGNNTAGSLETAKRNIEVAVNSMQTGLAQAFGPTLEQGANWITAHSEDIKVAFSYMAEGGKLFGSITLGAIGGVVTAFGGMVSVIGDGSGFVIDALEGLVGGMASVAEAVGADGIASQLRGAQDSLGGFSDKLHGLNDGISQFGSDLQAGASHLFNMDTGLQSAQNSAANAAAQIDHVRSAMANLPDGKNIDVNAIVTFRDTSGLVIAPDQLRTPTFTPAVPGETQRPRGGGRARGGIVDPSGRISGPGTGTSDSILAAVQGGNAGWITVSNQESINTAASTRANWPVIDAMNKGANLGAFMKALPGFADGGLVGPDVDAAKALVGTPYSQGNRTDCSGMVARVILRSLGVESSGGLMTTKNAADWLSKLGFQPGSGGPGAISVGWYDRGPNPNDGHMAMTLSDGTNAEAGGSNSVFTVGAGAAGADDPKFDHHMFLPNVFGEGAAGSMSLSGGGFSGSAGASGGAVGSVPAGSTPGVNEYGEQGYYTPNARQVREADQKVKEADARVVEAEARRRELAADAKESQKISADNALAKAKQDAEDARTDAEEAKRGKFTAAKPTSSSGGASGGSAGSTFKFPTAFSELAGLGLAGMGISTKVTANSPERTFGFGDVAAEAVGGQLGSALGVFGVNDSPGWLKAASTLISGISIGGGGSAAPLSAAPSGAGAAVPDLGDTHGLRAGQAPGPTYNITARDTEDAFIRAQRIEREKAAAKLSRF